MEKIDIIRNNNSKINNIINEIIKSYAGEVPKDVMERILTLEQRNIVSTYLAMYDNVIFDKTILQEDNLGDVQISKSCASGLNHKMNSVIIGDVSKQIKILKDSKEYGMNKNIDISAVKDMPTYIKYMIDKGGTELEFYLTTLPHEARHLMGVEGNSNFLEAKGFAEGKNELDTRRAMQYFGFEYYANRNYSMEVTFVEYLESLVGKDIVDELGSFKQFEYAKLVKEFGDVFKDFIKLSDQNSIKKDVRLYFENQGVIDLEKSSNQYQERAYVEIEKRKKEVEQFKEREDVGEYKYIEMSKAYNQINVKRKDKLKEMISRIPKELRVDVEKIMEDFDRIHRISNQDEMVRAYNDISLDKIGNYIKNRDINLEEAYQLSDDGLNTVINVQKAELEQLYKIRETSLNQGIEIINVEEVNNLAKKPEVATEVPVANNYNNQLSEKGNFSKELDDSIEK